MSHRTRVTFFAILSLVLALAACGRGTPGPQTNPPPPTSSLSALAPSAVPTTGTQLVAGNATPSVPTAQISPTQPPPGNATQPPAPTATQANSSGAEPTAAGGEGGGQPEGGSSVASLTDPGGLPPAPNSNSQAGEEKMAVYRDPQGRYQILFVSTWTSGPGSVPDSIKSASQDQSVQISLVNAAGKDAAAFAAGDEANVQTAAPGYQRLALKTGKIPYGPAASLIYRYQAGQNAVTGKALDFIAARVYIPRQGPQDIAVITVTGPAVGYGDLTQLFDSIVSSFKWL